MCVCVVVPSPGLRHSPPSSTTRPPGDCAQPRAGRPRLRHPSRTCGAAAFPAQSRGDDLAGGRLLLLSVAADIQLRALAVLGPRRALPPCDIEMLIPREQKASRRTGGRGVRFVRLPPIPCRMPPIGATGGDGNDSKARIGEGPAKRPLGRAGQGRGAGVGREPKLRQLVLSFFRTRGRHFPIVPPPGTCRGAPSLTAPPPPPVKL